MRDAFGRPVPPGDFVRLWVLFTVFDGDVDQWLDVLAIAEDANWVERDREFLCWFKTQARRDPTLNEKARDAIRSAEDVLEPFSATVH